MSTIHPSIHPSIGTILCAERWCCLISVLDYWAQSWTGGHSDTRYQLAGTHFADIGRMTGCQPHLVLIQQPSKMRTILPVIGALHQWHSCASRKMMQPAATGCIQINDNFLWAAACIINFFCLAEYRDVDLSAFHPHSFLLPPPFSIF